MSRLQLVLFVLVGLTFLTPGCGPDGPRTVPVHGKVTYNGTPLKSGSLVFAPDDISKVRPATGTIGADGTITVGTMKPGDGLMVGNYKVSVSSYSVDPVKTSPAELFKLKDGGLAIPKKYTDVATSGLTVSIVAGDAKKEINLDLKD